MGGTGIRSLYFFPYRFSLFFLVVLGFELKALYFLGALLLELCL
jgi:hypothetical protein